MEEGAELQNLSAAQIIDIITQEKNADLNQVYVMEIADKISGSRKECQKACRLILRILNTNNSKRILLCVEMVEICSKNGNLYFHSYLGTRQFSPVFLKLLERRRGKGLKHKFYSKDVKKRWDRIEEVLLYLVQLWADTFMMMEDEYPGFQVVYRQLRKENIKFPMRDPNVRMLMSNLVKDSPMFDYVEQIAGRSNQSANRPPPKSKKQIQLEQAQRELEMQAEQLDNGLGNMEYQEQESNDFRPQGQLYESQQEMNKLATKQLNDEDLEVVRSSLTILTEMREAAHRVEDMQGELATEITQACIGMRKQMAKIVEAKSMYGGMMEGADNGDDTIMQITIYLDMMDHIDNCLKEFKDKYLSLRERKLVKIQKKQEKVLNKLEAEKNKDKQEEEEQPKQDKQRPKKLDESSDEAPQQEDQNDENVGQFALQEEQPEMNQPPQQLIDFEDDQKIDLHPAQQQQHEEQKQEQPEPAPAKKKFGLMAPPKNNQHVLENVKSLNMKLKEQQAEQNENAEQPDKQEDLMDLLMGIDFNNKPVASNNPFDQI